MDKANLRKWLTTQVETAVQLSNSPPEVAVWGVILELPFDILENLVQKGAAYSSVGYHWFDYEQNGKTVCVPIKITDARK